MPHLIIVSLLLACVAVMIASMDIYLPASPYLTHYFQTSAFVIQVTHILTPFISAASMLFFGHYAGTKGRKPVLLFSLACMIGGSIISAAAFEIYTFIAGRIIQSFGASGLSVIVLIIFSDLYQGIRYAQLLAIHSCLFPITFALAPVIGSELFVKLGWRSCFMLISFCAAALYIALRTQLSETMKHIENAHPLQTIKCILSKRFYVALIMIHGLPIASSTVFSINAPFLFKSVFQFSPRQYAWTVAIPIALDLVGSLLYGVLLAPIGLQRCFAIGVGFACVFFVYCLGFLTHVIEQSFAHILISACVFNFGLPFILMPPFVKAIEMTGELHALSNAIAGIVRYGLMMMAVLCTGLFYNATFTPIWISSAFMMMLTLGLSLIVYQKNKNIFALQSH